MKRLFSILLVALAFIAVSCTDDSSIGFIYSLESTGEADGNVTLNFNGGDFTIDGTANYQFNWSNDTAIEANEICGALQECLESSDEKTLKAAIEVNNWIENSISVTSIGGNYDVYLKGYVKETLTGLVFAIDKHFTNKEVDSV